MYPKNKDLSTAVAKEVFRDLKVQNGFDYIRFPEKGAWRSDILSFHDSKITDIIMRRLETAIFPVSSIFSDNKLTGECICELSDGTPAITVDDDILRFRFDPFKMHFTNLNEGFPSNRTNALRQSAIIMYSNVPPHLRKRLRWLARRYKTANIRSLRDIGLPGASSNVIIHLIEQHMSEKGVVERNNRNSFAVVTHDVDTEFCQTEGREIISSIDVSEGIYATWFFVPRSIEYSLNRIGIRELMEEGHEVGMHGFTHDGKLALNNPARLAIQIRKGKRILESVGAKVRSFRSPWALRSALLLRTLASEGFMADSSYPDVDTLGMSGGQKGVSYNRPFRPLMAKSDSFVEALPLWEVPMTGPQDVQMIEDMRLPGSDLLKVWNYKADFCKDFGGVFVLHTHPKDIAKHLNQYVEILRTLKEKGFRMLRLDSLVEELQSNLGS